MPSLATKPSSIALFPTAADRSTLIPSAYQQHYLSPPLTPYPHFPLSLEKSPVTSPVSPYPQLPAFREMLPHENRQQQQPSPTDAEHFVYPTSAPSQPSGRQVQDLIEPNPIATYHSGQHMNDPTRLLPLYASHSPQIVTQTPPIVSPILRRNKAHVASACVNCKKAHLACDGSYPLTHPPCFALVSSIYGNTLFPKFLYPLRDSSASRQNCEIHVTESGLAPGSPKFRIYNSVCFISFFTFFFLFPIIRVLKGHGVGLRRSGIGLNTGPKYQAQTSPPILFVMRSIFFFAVRLRVRRMSLKLRAKVMLLWEQ